MGRHMILEVSNQILGVIGVDEPWVGFLDCFEKTTLYCSKYLISVPMRVADIPRA